MIALLSFSVVLLTLVGAVAAIYEDWTLAGISLIAICGITAAVQRGVA